ncbi:MAG: hypothetical protein U0166_01475 [Acidobacteriota bacterium]
MRGLPARVPRGVAEEVLDATDFLARVITHIAEPKLHQIHYYGTPTSCAPVAALPRRHARPLVGA